MKLFALGRLHEAGLKIEYFRMAGLSYVWDDFTPSCLCPEDELEWLVEQQAEQGDGFITEFNLSLTGTEGVTFTVEQTEDEVVVSYANTDDNAINYAEVLLNGLE